MEYNLQNIQFTVLGLGKGPQVYNHCQSMWRAGLLAPTFEVGFYGIPLWLSRLRTSVVSMRIQVPSPASRGG